MPDLMMGGLLLLAIYMEYKEQTDDSNKPDPNDDFVSRMVWFSIRIKTPTVIITLILYFIIRLIQVW